MTAKPPVAGSHASAVREANEKAILTELRRLGEASKADLARRVRLTQNTAGLIVRSLSAQGLIEETRKRHGLRGQPATLLRLAPEGAYAIGLKIGRRTQQSVLVDFSGRVLKARSRECLHPMPEEALSFALGDIEAMRDAIPSHLAPRLCGIGIATPYDLGSWLRELGLSAAFRAAWHDFDIGAEVRSHVDVPVFVENDGTAAAVAEIFNGHGRTLDDFATIFIGSAVGGGLVLGGNYRSGITRNAADVGLMPVPRSSLSSAPAPRGASDILLNRASAASLLRHFRSHGLPIDLTSQIDEALALHPDVAAEWIADCAEALTGPLFTITGLLDLQAIVIDGVLPKPLIRALIERLQTTMEINAPEARKPPMLLPGSIGRDAAALGAATLPFYASFSTGRGAEAAAASTQPTLAGMAGATP